MVSSCLVGTTFVKKHWGKELQNDEVSMVFECPGPRADTDSIHACPCAACGHVAVSRRESIGPRSKRGARGAGETRGGPRHRIAYSASGARGTDAGHDPYRGGARRPGIHHGLRGPGRPGAVVPDREPAHL